MTEQKEMEAEVKPTLGVEIDITVHEKELAPKFEPLIEHLVEQGRKITGISCSRSATTKLRW